MNDTSKLKPKRSQWNRVRKIVVPVALLILLSPIIDFALILSTHASVLTLRVDRYWDGGSATHYGLYYTIRDGRLSVREENNYVSIKLFNQTIIRYQSKIETELNTNGQPADPADGNPF